MDTKEIIIKIINLPHDFYNSGEVSVFSLLQDSGYFLTYNQINKDDILQELKKHTNVIDDWVNWSADKREGNGWYFERKGNDYIVGFYSTELKRSAESYNDPMEACATFIKYEIEDIRKS